MACPACLVAVAGTDGLGADPTYRNGMVLGLALGAIGAYVAFLLMGSGYRGVFFSRNSSSRRRGRRRRI